MDKQDNTIPESQDLTEGDLSESELDTITGGRTPHAYPLPPFTGGSGMPMPFWNEPTSLPLPPPASEPQDHSGQ